MKFLYVLIPSLALVACADPRPDTAQAPSAEQIDNDLLPHSESVREPSHVHTYIVNDYVDPNNPRLRHRGHLVDAVDQDEKWNLAPTGTTETDLGPVIATTDPNAAPNPYTAEFETELSQQRDQYRQLADLGGKMTTEVSKLQDMAEKNADAISENAELRNRLNELQQEIDTLKPATPSVVPNPPQKPSWWDPIFNLFWPPPQGKPVAATPAGFRTNAVLRPALTNAPSPTSPPAQPPPTNAANDAAAETVPPPGEMSTNEVIQL